MLLRYLQTQGENIVYLENTTSFCPGVPGRGRGDCSREESKAGQGGRGEGEEEAGRGGGDDEAG